MNFIKTATVVISVSAAMTACKKDEKNDESAPVATAVTDKPATATAVAAEPTTPKGEWTGDDTAKAFQDCWAAQNAKDEEKFIACYGAEADFAYVDFAPAMKATGADAVAGLTKMWWTAFPDVTGQAQLLLTNGSNFAAVVLMTQTNTGDGMMPATNKKSVVFEAQSGSFNAEGKYAAYHHHADQATMAHQMGMHKSEKAPDSETAWPKQIVVVAKNDDKEKANIEFVESLGALVDAQDRDKLLAAVSDDIFFRYVGDKKPATNKAEFTKGLDEYLGMVKITKRDVKSAWAAGDWVFTVSEVTAKMVKDMPMAKGTAGKEVKLTQTEFFQVAEGKLKTHWVFENTMQYAIQLGLMAPSKMGGDHGHDHGKDHGHDHGKAPSKDHASAHDKSKK
jgi:predicted ester cyclase